MLSSDNEEEAESLCAKLAIGAIKTAKTIKTRIRIIMAIVISDHTPASNRYIDKLRLVTGDICDQEVDAIITMIPQNLEYTGRINQAVLKRAGNELDSFILENMYKPKAGDVYALPGFGLPCKNIIMAVRPQWKSDFEREDKHLVTCVRKSIVLAKCMLLKSVALPPLASGRHGYGKGRAARLSIQAILDRLDERMEEVRIICPDNETYQAYKERLMAKGWRG
ncbi:MAG: macro domain-containing protein [Alphaproteobacteria bacterium]